MTRANDRAMIAMSGGVDSSAAALLTKRTGAECVGVTLKLFENADVGARREDGCCSLADADDARRVARALGIPHYVFDFGEDFKTAVIGRFVSEYLAGRTPNPCIDCNRHIKFERLLRRAEAMGFDRVVTGHYARVERDAATGRLLLKKATDASKDQSYVLYMMTQRQLAHTDFPLGALRKSEVRELAAAAGFANARKRDSQDICFVLSGSYADFIEAYTGRRSPPGDFADTDGNVIGRHAGIIRYTVGQRKGLPAGFPSPRYVCAKDAAANRVILGRETDLYTRTLEAAAVNLIATDRLDGARRVTAKTRYNGPASPATLRPTDAGRVRVDFDEPQRAVTAGQAVVFYDGETVVGGGTILAE